MSQIEIVEIIEQIKQEIEVDANGQAKASLRATARLAGVSAVAILKTLDSVNLEPSKLAQTLMESGFEAVNLTRIVIGNQYRSGQDSIAWHSDNESSMGYQPAIASLSLGGVRKFQIKPIGGTYTDFWLEHGSLLVMHPGCQSTHLHQVPKTNKIVTTRINLTFRPHTGGDR